MKPRKAPCNWAVAREPGGMAGLVRAAYAPPPPPPPRTKLTRRVPHPVLIGHAAYAH